MNLARGKQIKVTQKAVLGAAEAVQIFTIECGIIGATKGASRARDVKKAKGYSCSPWGEVRGAALHD